MCLDCRTVWHWDPTVWHHHHVRTVWQTTIVKIINSAVSVQLKGSNRAFDNLSKNTERSQDGTCSLQKGLNLLALCRNRETRGCLPKYVTIIRMWLTLLKGTLVGNAALQRTGFKCGCSHHNTWWDIWTSELSQQPQMRQQSISWCELTPHPVVGVFHT